MAGSGLRLADLGRSGPSGEAAPELVELEELHALARLRPRPGLRRVVAPRGEEEAHVLEVGMRGHVLQRLEAVLDEPHARATAVRRRVGGDERAQVVALVRARLLALDVRELHAPVVQDEPGKLSFLGGDEYRALRLAHEPAQLVEAAVGHVARDPVRTVRGDPLTPRVVQRMGEEVLELVCARLGLELMVADARPVAEDIHLRLAAGDGTQEQRHLPAREDDGTQPSEGGEERIAGSLFPRPRLDTRAPARLEILGHAVAQHTVEVDGEDVWNSHGVRDGLRWPRRAGRSDSRRTPCRGRAAARPVR